MSAQRTATHGRFYLVTALGKAALAEAAATACINWEITPEGRAALAVRPKLKNDIASSPNSSFDVAGILRGDSAAIAQLFALYSPLLRSIAYGLRSAGEDHRHVVTTVLDDVVVRMIETRQVPGEMSKYLIAALKNRLRNHHRNGKHRLARDESATEQHAEGVVPGCHSENGRRLADPDFYVAEPSSAVVNFAAWVLGELRDYERPLFDSQQSLSLIAQQLGLSYVTVRVRMHRARARIRQSAAHYLTALDMNERMEVTKLLRRGAVQQKL